MCPDSCQNYQFSRYILILNTELTSVFAMQSNARRGERHGEHPEELGHREDDSGGL